MLKAASFKPGEEESTEDRKQKQSHSSPEVVAAGILGNMFLRGEGIPQSNKTALKWFLRGEKKENPTCLVGLATLLADGVAVKKVGI